MLPILSAIFGFFAPFLPEILKFFTRAQDNKQEIELMKLRLQAGAQEALWRAEELQARADIEEARVLHEPEASTGSALLDAASKRSWPAWTIIPAFWLLTLLDFLRGAVRPGITYAIVGFYLLYKLARLQLMQRVSDQSFDWYQGIANLWGTEDWSVLTLVLGYWFGARVAGYAFGWKKKA